jgi:hypothetical protein
MTEKQETAKQFLIAARDGDVDVLATLLAKTPTLVKKFDTKNNTALLIAVAAIEKDAVKLLVEKGSDLAIVNKNGRNAIFISIENTSSADSLSIDPKMVENSEDILVILLNAGCSPLAKTTAGYPLHSANQRVQRILLDHKDKWLRWKISSHVVSEIVAPMNATWTSCAEQTELIQLISNAIEPDAMPEPVIERKQEQPIWMKQSHSRLKHLQQPQQQQPQQQQQQQVEPQPQQVEPEQPKYTPVVSTNEGQSFQVNPAMCHKQNVDAGVRKRETPQVKVNPDAPQGRSYDRLRMEEAMRARNKRIRRFR